MTVYSYSRVSTGRQASEGESLDAQQARCAGYAMMNGDSVAQAYVERGVSGTVHFLDRTEGARLWDVAKAGDKIIACKLDRVFRSSLDALETLKKFQERGVELHLIDLGGNVCGNGIAKLVFTILSAVAEAERERIRDRVCEVKAYQKEQGRYLGGKVPFGYAVDDNGQLVEDDDQQRAINTMVDERGRGFSLRKIAETVQNRHGITISFKAISDILDREKANPRYLLRRD